MDLGEDLIHLLQTSHGSKKDMDRRLESKTWGRSFGLCEGMCSHVLEVATLSVCLAVYRCTGTTLNQQSRL